MIRITDSIRSKVLESTLAVAGHFDRIGRREGKPRGAVFIMGDSHNVPIWSGQLAPNPQHAYEDRLQRITNPDTNNTFNEFSKLDGAFVIRGDGFIRSAGMFIGSSWWGDAIATGLGARYLAFAADTAHWGTQAVAVSVIDGNVSAFSGGRLLSQMESDLPRGTATLDE